MIEVTVNDMLNAKESIGKLGSCKLKTFKDKLAVAKFLKKIDSASDTIFKTFDAERESIIKEFSVATEDGNSSIPEDKLAEANQKLMEVANTVTSLDIDRITVDIDDSDTTFEVSDIITLYPFVNFGDECEEQREVVTPEVID